MYNDVPIQKFVDFRFVDINKYLIEKIQCHDRGKS